MSMASADIWVRKLVKYYTTAELEAAELAILQAEAGRIQDVVQITSQSSRAGSATGISISPDERATWLRRIEEALNELNGTTDFNDKWFSQDFSTRIFGT
jgi:hypothetical protein